MIQLRKINDFLYEMVDGGNEPLFHLTKENQFWHQSGYGYLSPSQVTIIKED